MDLVQNTATTIKLGPFLDKDDNTVLSGLAGSMTVYIAKAGGTLAARSSASAITYDADGFYNVPLAAGDVDTLGNLLVEVVNDATHLPVWDYYTVKKNLDTGESPNIICEWGGQSSNAYICLSDANSFILNNIVDHLEWTEATSLQMAASLIEATRDIDSRQFVGWRYYDYQKLQFPRRMRGTFPWNNTMPASLSSYEQLRMKDDVKRANCIQALHILRNGGRNIHAERQAMGIAGFSETVGPISESYRYARTGGAVGVTISPEALAVLSPWLQSKKIFRA